MVSIHSSPLSLLTHVFIHFHVIGELGDFGKKIFKTLSVLVLSFTIILFPPLAVVEWVQTFKEVVMH